MPTLVLNVELLPAAVEVTASSLKVALGDG